MTYEMMDTGGGIETLSAQELAEAFNEMDRRFPGWRRSDNPYSLYEDNGQGSHRIWLNRRQHGDWEQYAPQH